MIYVALAREVWTRLEFHKAHGIADADPLLAGLSVVKSGVFRVDGDKDLPQVTIVDLNAAERAGNTTGRLTLFLKTKRKDDWVRMAADEKRGLMDWAELVMDAIELSPSTGQADAKLCPHRTDGTAIKDRNGGSLELLAEDFTYDVRMSEINDLSFLLEIDIVYKIPMGKRGNRRTSPVSAAQYAAT